ncbi:MAG TPA: hypothetical protein VFU81_00845, partial [Thermomicrobiales bacterium]|nr:hypothetical protein [Thermomicrobiales bacterium]
MRINARRVVLRRGLVYVTAAGLCLGSAPPAVWAQDTASTGGPATITAMGEPVLLREWPGYDAAVLATLSDGSALTVTGAPVTAGDGSSWLPADVGGQRGFVPAGHVNDAPPE